MQLLIVPPVLLCVVAGLLPLRGKAPDTSLRGDAVRLQTPDLHIYAEVVWWHSVREWSHSLVDAQGHSLIMCYAAKRNSRFSESMAQVVRLNSKHTLLAMFDGPAPIRR